MKEELVMQWIAARSITRHPDYKGRDLYDLFVLHCAGLQITPTITPVDFSRHFIATARSMSDEYIAQLLTPPGMKFTAVQAA